LHWFVLKKRYAELSAISSAALANDALPAKKPRRVTVLAEPFPGAVAQGFVRIVFDNRYALNDLANASTRFSNFKLIRVLQYSIFLFLSHRLVNVAHPCYARKPPDHIDVW